MKKTTTVIALAMAGALLAGCGLESGGAVPLSVGPAAPSTRPSWPGSISSM